MLFYSACCKNRTLGSRNPYHSWVPAWKGPLTRESYPQRPHWPVSSKTSNKRLGSVNSLSSGQVSLSFGPCSKSTLLLSPKQSLRRTKGKQRHFNSKQRHTLSSAELFPECSTWFLALVYKIKSKRVNELNMNYEIRVGVRNMVAYCLPLVMTLWCHGCCSSLVVNIRKKIDSGEQDFKSATYGLWSLCSLQCVTNIWKWCLSWWFTSNCTIFSFSCPVFR